MPAPVVAGFTNFLVTELNVNVWDGEIPRYDTSGNPVSPGVVNSPSNWPVVQLKMTDSGLTREWTFADPYDDEGPLDITVYGISRITVEETLGGIEALLASESNWADMVFEGGPVSNPFYLISALLKSWTCVMEEGVRVNVGTTSVGLPSMDYLYRGEMHYDIKVHGAIATS